MTEQDRSYFQDKADLDKLRYLKEMREFYDEVQRIGDRVGTVKAKTGQYNVATTFSKLKEPSEDEEKNVAVQRGGNPDIELVVTKHDPK